MGDDDQREEEKLKEEICAEESDDGICYDEEKYLITLKFHGTERYPFVEYSAEGCREQAIGHIMSDFEHRYDEIIENHITIEVEKCKHQPKREQWEIEARIEEGLDDAEQEAG